MQLGLMHESINDALREVVQACGGHKAVGAEMRPELPVDQAAGWVRDCLNPDRREKFSPEQVVFLLRKGRAVGSHAGINYLAREAGYADPQPVEPESEVARTQREFVEATRHLSKLAERIEAMQGRTA